MDGREEERNDPFWLRLEEHERDQLREYVDMLIQNPEAICASLNPSRRQEFVRLLAKGLGLNEPGQPV